MSKQHWVATLKKGQALVDLFAAQDKSISLTADNRRYLRLRLGDRTGWVSAVAWDNPDQLYAAFEDGDVVKVMGEVEEFRGRLQLKVKQLRRARPEDRVDPADFVASSRFPPGDLLARLDELVASVQNPWLRRLLEITVGRQGSVRQAFAQGSAAKEVHHAYIGGLLEHVIEMAALGRVLCQLHPEYADPDMVTTAIVFHDIGKLQEFTRQGHGFVHTREGELHGHVYMGARWLEQQAAHIAGFPPDLLEELVHCILSHHGTPDRGAVVLPRTMNAWIVHLADDASAKLNQVRRLYERADQGAGSPDGWSEYDQRLGIRAYTGFLQADYEGDEALVGELWSGEPPAPPPPPVRPASGVTPAAG